MIQKLVNNYYQPPAPPPVAVADIYPNGYVVPEGYEAVRFGRVMAKEDWLSPHNNAVLLGSEKDAAADFIRIIVRHLPKRKVVTFTATGEVRAAKNGEWYSDNPAHYHSPSPGFWCHTGNWPTQFPYPIYTRTETEV